MAVQQSGNVGTKPGMRDRNPSSDLPRAGGAAKRPQTSFPVKGGMVDQTSMTGVSPGATGDGPDASSANVLDPEPSDRVLRKQPTVLTAKWGMTGPDGKGLDVALGKRVIAEGKLPVDPFV